MRGVGRAGCGREPDVVERVGGQGEEFHAGGGDGLPYRLGGRGAVEGRAAAGAAEVELDAVGAGPRGEPYRLGAARGQPPAGDADARPGGVGDLAAHAVSTRLCETGRASRTECHRPPRSTTRLSPWWADGSAVTSARASGAKSAGTM
ncbi:hypothetical protein SFUMM280S_02660 [Streptomyces fumanus]